ncbi:pyridoxamine 5'-phosphate oxidase [Streptomyces griseoflavus]|uniref:pyridoxamine 5'-phosphate oxidase family protein n=1 Tax=Streptomyces rimosus TaxID=1927 RepID=UPI0004CC28E8|nr:pyridoxamine 5'-phosphate oxidase family protein [Streptomyces rimosus]KOG51960.1 pyridoxamine 5'-phosphate oxidase [Streptomyces griseoflavus]KWT62312.1 pyridoxamine 5'-phosphate oxidase [Streptomyces albus subsp. albus]
MSLAMTTADREAFLAGAHVAVLGVGAPDGPPLLVPVWYAYRPGGEIVVLTGRKSVKARRIRAAGRLGLCVQRETAPYQYVSVEGPVTAFEDRVDAAERAALAHRYLPPETARAYLAATADQLTTDVTVRMRPERWRTADFASFAAAFS